MPSLLTQEEWNYWYTRVYGYFYRRLDSRFDAEELTSSTLNDFFLKENVQSQHGLIWAIAKNKFKDHLKSKYKSTSTVELDEAHDQAQESQEHSLHFQSKMSNLQECIKNQLKGLDQKIL